MASIHELCNNLVRRIRSKVQIIYSSPFLDEQISVDASSVNRSIDLDEVTDSIQETPHKWFSLFDNTLDGSFHPRPGTYDKGTASVGWWGNVLSDSGGNISPSEQINLTFDRPRPIFTLSVYGDDAANVYPVDFLIYCLDENNNNIYSIQITDNTTVDWTLTDLNIIDVKSIHLIVTKINKANHVVRVTEFYNSVRKEYLDDKIRSIDLLEELNPVSGDIPLGEVSANEIDITLDNSDGEFELSNPNSPVRNFLKKHRKISAWLGIDDENDVTNWVKLGVFWSTEWNVPRGRTIAKVTGRDVLELMRYSDYYTCPTIQTNKTLYDAFYDVMLDFGLSFGDFIIDTALQSIVIPKYWLDRMTYREALQELASMANIQIYVDRNSVINIKYVEPTSYTQQTFTVSTNLFDYSNPSMWQEQYNKVNVNVSNVILQAREEILRDETGFTFSGYETKTLEIYYNTTPCTDIETPTFGGTSYLSIQDINYYSWGVIMEVKNNSSSTQTATYISAYGKPYTVEPGNIVSVSDLEAIDEYGILAIDISSPLIQTESYARILAQQLVEEYKNTRVDIELDNRGDLDLKLEDKIQVELEETGTYEDYYVKRQELTYVGSLRSKTEGRKI